MSAVRECLWFRWWGAFEGRRVSNWIWVSGVWKLCCTEVVLQIATGLEVLIQLADHFSPSAIFELKTMESLTRV